MCYNGDGRQQSGRKGGTQMDPNAKNPRKAGKEKPGSSLAPATSTTMLREIGGDSQHARWWEFERKYRPMMEEFLASHGVPAADRDDIIQETLLGVMRKLPNYRYCPEEKGPFRNYLRGILSNKAKDMWTGRARRERHAQAYGKQEEAAGRLRVALDYDTGGGKEAGGAQRVLATVDRSAEDERRAWQMSLCEIAIQQLLADEEVKPLHREIFRRAWLEKEDGTSVAESLMVSRDVVYQVKKRLLKRVEAIVARLQEVE